MATQLKIQSCSEITHRELHFVPTEIKHNGQANVNAYFEPVIREEDDGSKKVFIVN